MNSVTFTLKKLTDRLSKALLDISLEKKTLTFTNSNLPKCTLFLQLYYNMYKGNYMDKKLIFLDIDGTLSRPGQPISEETKEAIDKVRENGHLVFINTGRTHKDIPEHIQAVDFDGYVCSAGGKITYQDETIKDSFLTDDEVKQIREVLDSLGINYVLEGKYHNFGTTVNFFVNPKDLEGASSELARMLAKNSGVKTPRPIKEYDGEPIYKVNFRIDMKNPEHRDIIQDSLKDDFRIDYFINVFNDFGFLGGEVTRYDINKGNAIKTLSEYFDVPMEDTIAYGDSMNDLDMIKAAGLGIAMDNSDESVKEIADAVCESVDDNGVAKSLKDLKLY